MSFRITGQTMAPHLVPGDLVELSPGRRPARFDLVVYRRPGEESKQAIGRVLGLPGESIELSGSALFIDGREVDDAFVTASGSYTVRFDLAADEYAIFGDNREISLDSHVLGPIAWGYVVASGPH